MCLGVILTSESPRGSDPLRLLDRPLVPHVAGVERRARLEKKQVDLLLDHRPVLDAAWDDQKLPRLEPHIAVAKLQLETASEDQLVFVIVVMPDELAFEVRPPDCWPLTASARSLGIPRKDRSSVEE